MLKRVGAALFGAAYVLSSFAASAGSEDSGARFLFFSGGDVWQNGGFLHGGVLWSPDGLDKEGFVFKALLSGGTYQYTSGALGGATVTGREMVAQFLPGWRFKWGANELTLFAGLDAENHRLTPDDPSSGLRGNDVGGRIAFTYWTEPTPATMLAADGSLSSIATNYSLRGALGYRLFETFYLGPEIESFANDSYRQNRIGLHLTAWHLGNAEVSAAAGWAKDSDHRNGGYLRFGILTRR